ncbi:MAG: radical SAM protein [Bradymonadales bacterium]|nr:radical SAM protein [Bradymonadales bacterium]
MSLLARFMARWGLGGSQKPSFTPEIADLQSGAPTSEAPESGNPESSRQQRTPAAASPSNPTPVELWPDQPHPIDLGWVDEFVADIRPHVMVRPEDELLILVPNRPHKMNRTAIRILHAMVHEGQSIRQILAREGDSPHRRREIHFFFSDLLDLLRGTLGEGWGRKAVVQEPFSADFCTYPVLSEVALTYRCNASCKFCYAGCRKSGLPDGWDERRTLSYPEMCRVLEVIRNDARCPSVSFTGGEPTLRPDLPELVAHARSLGLKVNLITNGQALGDRLVDELASAGLDSAQVSLEGATAAVHDLQVGTTGAFDRLWKGIERLRSRSIRVHTNTTITRHNLGGLEQIVDLIAGRGLDRLTMNLVIPSGMAASKRAGLQVSYREIGRHLLRVRDRACAAGVRFIWYSPVPVCLFNTVAEGLSSQGCAAADGLLHVNPAGEVLPCSSFRHDESLGNLLARPFREIWDSQAALFFRKKEMVPFTCKSCPHLSFCQGACILYWREVGLAELEHGDQGRPPFPRFYSTMPMLP